MSSSLTNKTIVVAGAAGLLGSSVVKAILDQGGFVIAGDLDLQGLKSRLTELDIDVTDNTVLKMVELNVTIDRSVAKLFELYNNIDGAVNCTYPRNSQYGAHFYDVELSNFNENISLQLGSAFNFSQASAKYFQKYKTPFSLVNISSIYGTIAPRFDVYNETKMTMPVEYAAVKAGINHLSKYVAAYVNNSNFRVNIVSPGGIFDSQPDEFVQAYKGYTHGEGMLNVKDVVGSILFLLSEDSKFVTGQNLIVDDGFTL